MLKNKNLLTASILLALSPASFAVNFHAIVQLTDVSLDDPVPLIGWYPYLEDNCEVGGVTSYPDLASWESAGSIVCNGSEKQLPTIGDLTNVNGSLSIGSAGDYYYLRNNQALSGLTLSGKLDLFLEGEGLLLNNFDTKNPIINKNLNLNVKDIKKIDLVDVESENINIFGDNTNKSTVNSLNLDVAKSKASQVTKIAIKDLKSSSIESTDSALSSYTIELNDSEDIRVDLTQSGIDSSDIVSLSSSNSTFNSIATTNSHIGGSLTMPTIDGLEPNKNDISSLTFNGGSINGLSIEKASNIGNVIFKDLEYSYFSMDGDRTGIVKSEIGDVTFSNVITSAPLNLYNVKKIGNIKLENLNNISGGENNYFGLSIMPNYNGVNKDFADIDSVEVLNSKAYLTASLRDMNNIGFLNVDNLEGNAYFDLDLTEDLGYLNMKNSLIGNYLNVESRSIGDILIDKTTIDNYTAFNTTGSIGLVTFNEFITNNYVDITADSIGDVSFNDIFIDNFLDVEIANGFNSFTLTDATTNNYISVKNAENITITNHTNENWSGVSADDMSLDLNLNASNLKMEQSSGYFRISGYDNVNNITIKDSKLNMGVWINLSNSTGKGDINEITYENIENMNGYGHELLNIDSLNTLNIINNKGFQAPIIRVAGLTNGISNVNITNTHSTPVVIGDADKTFSNHLSSISHIDNLVIGLMSVSDGADPSIPKLSNSSVFCTNYGVSTFVYTSIDFGNTNTGTLVNKSYICN